MKNHGLRIVGGRDYRNRGLAPVPVPHRHRYMECQRCGTVLQTCNCPNALEGYIAVPRCALCEPLTDEAAAAAYRAKWDRTDACADLAA
jgi:hypothetical protein